tara:strand:+ start:1505 stop:1810 length:306 start_codon:yes stop_codon:yes gene_type:complete
MADITAYHVRGRSQSESLGILSGAGGADYVSNATVNSHTYVAITAMDTDSTTVSATSLDTDVWDSLSAIELPVGTTIYGKWSAVTIGSGDAAMVYRESSTT